MAVRETYHYPEGMAPFGELDVFLPHANGNRDLMIEPDVDHTTIVGRARTITRRAWLNSKWFQMDIGKDEALRILHEDEVVPFEQMAQCGIITAQHVAGEAIAFALKRTPLDRDENYVHNPKDKARMWPAIVGYSQVAMNEFGVVGNTNVLPRVQGKKIGAALLYHSTGKLPSEMQSTTYVAAINKSLLAKLGELGYTVTGSRKRPDLLGKLYPPIVEHRLLAPSVGRVREVLAERYPWLNDAKYSEETY